MQNTRKKTLWLVSLSFIFLSAKSTAIVLDEKISCEKNQSQYSYSWPIDTGCNNKPRGGTSTGAKTVLAVPPSKAWLALQQSGLSTFERDRLAILAMEGPYKVNFDFLEIVGFDADFKRDKPYQSWGTEYVYIVEDRGDFISLQHVMVMYFEAKDGSVSEPMVMKHWRQDWTYEDKSLLLFEHDKQWRSQKVAKKLRKGRWSQAVFQVDDSPRYEAMGRWQHNPSFSTWVSDNTRRPLPRREYSVRDDYQALEGVNRHTITRTGWVQEEENLKLVIDAKGKPSTQAPYRSKELGLARYQRVSNVDFTPGDRYMALAGQFWRDVRREWQVVFSSAKTIKLHARVNGKPLFSALFAYAAKVQSAGEYDAEQGREFARATIQQYVM